ncbi:MAG: aldehyde ferredoxin oxidoreductase C-terminal domain-containing protein [Candidatus Caldarchaeum sp.]
MRIAEIDLSGKSVVVHEFPDLFEEGVWGGRCLGVGLIARNASVNDALDPDSPLVVAVGSLGGTGFPLGNRLTLVFRSPLTGTIAWAHTGGYAAYTLAALGFSALYITGSLDKLSAMVLTDDGISFVDVEGLRGRGAVETCAAMRLLAGDARVLAIGPAGEKQLPIATVVNDMGRSSGVRHGAGSVFGSKNLKAIVMRTKKPAPLPRNPTRHAQLIRMLKAKLDASPLLNLEKGLLAVHGTAVAAEALGSNEVIPLKNYTQTTSEKYLLVGGRRLSETVLVRRMTCSFCPVSCRRETVAYGVRGEGPDYAQISSLGTNCMVFDLAQISYMTQLCYEMGVDPIEMGNSLAVYADLSEKKLVGKRLEWGDFETMSRFIYEAGYGGVVGEILGKGAAYTARYHGAEELAPSVKNISIQNADPRAEKAWGVINAVENFGAGCHIWVYPNLVQSFRQYNIPTIFDNDASEEIIANRIYRKQAEVAALDSLGVCAFSRLVFDIRDYLDGLETVYGQDVADVFLDVGEYVLRVERYLNNLYGFGDADDRLPRKFTEEPLPSGRHGGEVCDVEEILRHYRRVRASTDVSGFINKFPKLG